MKIKKISFKDSDGYFYLAWVLYELLNLFKLSFVYSYYMSVYKYLSALVLVPVMLSELSYIKRVSIREFIGLIICIFGIISVLITNNSSNITIISMLILIYCGRNRRLAQINRYSLYCGSFVLLLVILCAKFGLIINHVSTIGNRTREYLGFRYALYPSVISMMITCMYVYDRGKEIRTINGILLMILNYYIYNRTGSRLSSVISAVVIIFGLILKYAEIKQKRWGIRGTLLRILNCSYLIACIMSFIFVYLYAKGNSFAVTLNSILGRRLFYSLRSLEEYGFGMLGKNIKWVGFGLNALGERGVGTYLYVDNIYIHMLQENGLIMLVVYLLLNTMLLFHISKRNNRYLYLIVIVLAYYGMIDNLTRFIHINIFLFAISCELIKKHSENVSRRITNRSIFSLSKSPYINN